MDIRYNDGRTPDQFVKSLDSPEPILHQCFVLVQLVQRAKIFRIEARSYKSVLREFRAYRGNPISLKPMESNKVKCLFRKNYRKTWRIKFV